MFAEFTEVSPQGTPLQVINLNPRHVVDLEPALTIGDPDSQIATMTTKLTLVTGTTRRVAGSRSVVLAKLEGRAL